MRTGLGMALGAGLLALGAAPTAGAQSPGAPAIALPHRGAQVLLSSGGLASVQSLAQEEIIREIDDPHTGDRWLLMRNDLYPGGPGRMVLIAAHRNGYANPSQRAAAETGEALFPPVIRAGDRLIVEEHTARVDAALEARALNPAAAGSALDARLTIGGRVVRAVALGPGRAALQPETGVRPWQ